MVLPCLVEDRGSEDQTEPRIIGAAPGLSQPCDADANHVQTQHRGCKYRHIPRIGRRREHSSRDEDDEHRIFDVVPQKSRGDEPHLREEERQRRNLKHHDHSNQRLHVHFKHVLHAGTNLISASVNVARKPIIDGNSR